MLGAVAADRLAIGAAVLAACGRALEHVNAAPALLRISELVERYENGMCNRAYLLMRLEGIR